MPFTVIDDDSGEIITALPGPFIRTGGPNYSTDQVSLETGLECKDPSLAVQSDAEDADINTIVKRFGLTGQLPTNGRVATFGDFDQVDDYHTAMLAIRRAEEAFMALPGAIRAEEFRNDPQRFVAFCSDPANLPRLRELGLANPPPVPEPLTDPPPPPPGGSPAVPPPAK